MKIRKFDRKVIICPFECDDITLDTDRVEVSADGYAVTMHGLTFVLTDAGLHAWADAFKAAQREFLELTFEAEAL